ncbi:hypothetical protein BD410DRAFT_118962 [Rickenella mellea]|uniref:F-box domain-containing protein n=1 Tax=Rickenella mellea TaxID=50990 RepID=A0A4Y7Q9V4_9AGAM|nr:hypothetical protein BD410DRAFT_118962 [Rickenella mellea]
MAASPTAVTMSLPRWPPQLATPPSPLAGYSHTMHPSAKLPNELWRQVFSFATMVPRGFDTSLTSPFDFSEISDGYNAFLKRLSKNHRTKQAICLVSRKFRAIAQELIFEYLFLQDGFDWNKLAEGLETSRDIDEAQGGRGAGWYVKRLEICTANWLCKEAMGAAAARVIRCCPNLRRLMIGGSDEAGIPAELVHAVFETCPQALRCLQWATDLGPQTRLMLSLLPVVRNLEFLFLYATELYIPSSDPNHPEYNAEFPNLHTLEIVATDLDVSGLLNVMATWKIPRLQHVIITGARQTGSDDPLPFFLAHGACISILEFDYLTDFHGNACDQALALCTSLQDLILHVHFAPVQARAGHPKVKRIGIRGLNFLDCSHSSVRTALDSLKYTLTLVLSRFPSLEAVRLLDFEQERFKLRMWRSDDVVQWAFWVQRFKRREIRLEDHRGDVIDFAISDINIVLPEDPPQRCPHSRGLAN